MKCPWKTTDVLKRANTSRSILPNRTHGWKIIISVQKGLKLLWPWKVANKSTYLPNECPTKAASASEINVQRFIFLLLKYSHSNKNLLIKYCDIHRQHISIPYVAAMKIVFINRIYILCSCPQYPMTHKVQVLERRSWLNIVFI